MIGLVMILISIALVLIGQLVLDSYLQENPQRFAYYWGACGLFALAALFTAMMDMVLVRREAAREERKLVQQTFGRQAKPPEDSGKDDERT